MSRNAGNCCLLFLQRLSLLILILLSVCFIACGIYLAFNTQNAGAFEVGFILLGTIELLFSLIGLNSKNSKIRMNCFLSVIGSICLVQAITAGICIALKQKIMDWANNPNTDNSQNANTFANLIAPHIDLALIIVSCVSGIQVI